MAALRKGRIFETAWMQVRHRKTFDVRKPKPGSFARRMLVEITKPILPPDTRPPALKCTNTRKSFLEKEEANPYEAFLLGQCEKMLQNSNMIAVYQVLPLKAEEKKAVKNKLHKKGLYLMSFNNQIMQKAISSLKIVNLSPLFVGHNVCILSPEPKVSDMLKITNRIPQLHLLGGFVGDCLLSREGLLHFAKLPHIDHLLGELVSILSTGTGKTKLLLDSHTQNLTIYLQQYIKQQRIANGNSSSQTH